MQYVLLIYDDPKQWENIEPAQMESIYGEYMAVSQLPNTTGGSQLQAGLAGLDGAAADHDRRSGHERIGRFRAARSGRLAVRDRARDVVRAEDRNRDRRAAAAARAPRGAKRKLRPRRRMANARPPFARDWAFFLDIDGTLLDIAPTPRAVHTLRADTKLVSEMEEAQLMFDVGVSDGRSLDPIAQRFVVNLDRVRRLRRRVDRVPVVDQLGFVRHGSTRVPRPAP